MSEDDIVKRLELIARLLAFNITQEEKSRNDKVRKLKELGLEPEDIVIALGLELKRVNEAIKKRQGQGSNKKK